MEFSNNLQTKIILSILLPPLAMYQLKGGSISIEFFISIFLTALFWIPGSLYVMGLTIWDHYSKNAFREENNNNNFIITNYEVNGGPYLRGIENSNQNIELLEPKAERFTRFEDFSSFTLNPSDDGASFIRRKK